MAHSEWQSLKQRPANASVCGKDEAKQGLARCTSLKQQERCSSHHASRMLSEDFSRQFTFCRDDILMREGTGIGM